MYQEKYFTVGKALESHQKELIRGLLDIVDAYYNLEANASLLHHLVYSLTEAFFVFLHNLGGNIPAQLGEELNQIKATPMFLAGINKTMREFCFSCLSGELLIAGLEATADFYNYLVQAYIQTNQGLLLMGAISRQERLRLKASLTEREVEVLRRLVEGHTNRQIAAAMGVTERTVVNYLKQARQKLGTQRRLETILAAAKLFNL
ncbi:MAG: helix-turn-helix transcriptional regulator [Anaerolineae bacterium]|nr:helix-turn-helix transcriptional regulator [Anaerolineae bacterium]